MNGPLYTMYPLLSKLSAPSSLCPQLRTILLAAGHVAAGDATSTAAAFRYIEEQNLDKAYELCILQAAPLVGIPRALHSAAALQAVGIVGDRGNPIRDANVPKSRDETSVTWLRDTGWRTFQSVYGRNSSRVRQRLADFHPSLERWIVSHVYGAVFSNETAADGAEMSLRERELCVVAMLCGDVHAAVQLASHLRGALNAGATGQEVEAVVEQTEVVHGAAAAASAKATWATYERARYAL